MIQYDCYFMGKSAYAPCGQAASVGVPVGCVKIAMAALHPIGSVQYCLPKM